MKTFYSKKGDRLSKEILLESGGELTYFTVMKLLRKRQIKVNGKRTAQDIKTCAGDEIVVYYDTKERAIRVLFEDKDVLAVYKPKGITSEDFFTLVSKTYPTACFVHRLDRNTDGVMLFALNDVAYGELLEGFKNRTFKKTYEARVVGAFASSETKKTLVAYLKKDAEKSLVTVKAKPERGYDKIITEYEVIESDGRTSLLKIDLITGKTHQIRAHLAFIGHPVLGDGKYGDFDANRQYGLKRQLLTAVEITLFFAPTSPLRSLDGKTITVDVENRLSFSGKNQPNE